MRPLRWLVGWGGRSRPPLAGRAPCAAGPTNSMHPLTKSQGLSGGGFPPPVSPLVRIGRLAGYWRPPHLGGARSANAPSLAPGGGHSTPPPVGLPRSSSPGCPLGPLIAVSPLRCPRSPAWASLGSCSSRASRTSRASPCPGTGPCAHRRPRLRPPSSPSKGWRAPSSPDPPQWGWPQLLGTPPAQ